MFFLPKISWKIKYYLPYFLETKIKKTSWTNEADRPGLSGKNFPKKIRSEKKE